MQRGSAFSIPVELRANDVIQHILNIDSRFRESAEQSSSSQFYFRLKTPVKNVLRIRITSVEFPNSYYAFSAARKNLAFNVIYGTPPTPNTYPVRIPPGNYNINSLIDVLTTALSGISWLSVDFNPEQALFIFTGNQRFSIDTTFESINRPFDYGLGYNLGFTRGGHIASLVSPGTYSISSDSYVGAFGDNYVFLQVNDYGCVRQTLPDNEFMSLAKIVFKEDKLNFENDDYGGGHIKEVVFPSPVDLTRFFIQIRDPYGTLVELGAAQFSFSMEVLEVKNSSLYDTIRDSLTLQYR
jgi:hypothetical protein